jgi:hypothetical protein
MLPDDFLDGRALANRRDVFAVDGPWHVLTLVRWQLRLGSVFGKDLP